MSEDISDGYHTMQELYNHRHMLFIALCRSMPELAWRARIHDDGSAYEGWFIAGIHLPTGDISYHFPIELWELFDNSMIVTSNKAPKWDGHTASDVLERLKLFCKVNEASDD